MIAAGLQPLASRYVIWHVLKSGKRVLIKGIVEVRRDSFGWVYSPYASWHANAVFTSPLRKCKKVVRIEVLSDTGAMALAFERGLL